MIRSATPQDVPHIHRLMRELAEYERSLAEVTATEDDLRRALFADQPAIFAHVAEHEGSVAGFALWFLNYSTWLGRHGIYLEDLYVTPAVRGTGLGRALLAELLTLASAHGFHSVIARVAGHNETSIALHRAAGFELVGVEREVGRKHRQWLDVVELQRLL